MLKSRQLAKFIYDQYITIKKEDTENILTSLIENFRLNSINEFINSKNIENYNKINEKQVLPKIQNPNIKRVTVWPRGS